MLEAKRRRLEAKGWKVGGTKEFLGLTDQEAALIELKLSLADSLRKKRMKRRWKQAQVAKILSSSQSRVAKMEAADESVSLDLMIRSLYALGTSNPELGRIIGRSHAAAAR